MGYGKPCTHGKTLCGLYKSTRRAGHFASQAVSTADNFLTKYGKDVGAFAVGISPVVAASGNPVAAGIIAGGGEFAREYAKIRKQIPNN